MKNLSEVTPWPGRDSNGYFLETVSLKCTYSPRFCHFFTSGVTRNDFDDGAYFWHTLLDDRGFESRQGLAIFLFTTASRPTLGPTQPSIQWVTGSLSLGVKRPGLEADHSPLSSAEVKNAWSYTSLPQYASMAWCAV
jgi:hypothetical protein